jgi:hypothetical protein
MNDQTELTSGPVATGASMVVYGITLSEWVLIGWLVYIIVCLIPKISPALSELRRWWGAIRGK